MSRKSIDRSGVWRFRELVLPIPEVECFVGEGNANLYEHKNLNRFSLDAKVQLKHEEENQLALSRTEE